MKASIDNLNTMYSGRAMAGIIILSIGTILLIDQFGVLTIPQWLYSWPMWIIGYGLYMGGKYNFKKPFYVVVILVGTALLLTENIDNADTLVWPAAIMAAGVWLVLKHSKHPVIIEQQQHYTQV